MKDCETGEDGHCRRQDSHRLEVYDQKGFQFTELHLPVFPLLNISGVWQTEAESNKAWSCLSEEGGGRRPGDRRGNNPYLLLDKESGTLQNSHIGIIF